LLHLGSFVSSAEAYRLSPDRLCTHGVVLGMTGSGKTGLAFGLLEELATAGVPVIAIDPKGDLANLGRAWPASEDTAWREGLRAAGVTDERIRALRERVEVVVHTPGSRTVRPVDVLGALSLPRGATDEDLADAATSATGALLSLAGIVADPVRDPRAVVLATLIREAWRAGEEPDVEQLVLRLIDPPFAKVGVFPLDSFLPREDRMAMAMSLNAVLASPGFEAWRAGEGIDVDTWLAPRDGRTPIHVMYLAHLDDAARSFFCALLLSRVVSWTRRQPGTDHLRAALFFDEVFGFLPPHPHDPPTKRPLLTLLKQARAVGLGVVLCTQNPVDVDYKALSNAGWWAVGRLSTARDRERVLEGMVADPALRAELDASIAGLAPRTFAIRDVREDGAVTVRSRWAMSYLGGPRTLAELREAAPPQALAQPAVGRPAPADDTVAEPANVPSGELSMRWWSAAERFGPDFFPMLGDGRPPRPDGQVVYAPALLATLRMLFDERGFEHRREAQRLFYPLRADATGRDVVVRALSDCRPTAARYVALPVDLDEGKEIKHFTQKVKQDILNQETTKLFSHPSTKLQSFGGESRDAFQARVDAALRDQVDAAVAKLKDKVEAEVQRLEAKRDKLERDQARHAADAKAKLASEVVGAGEALLGLFFGRSRSLSSAVSRRASTAKAQGRAADAAEDLQGLQAEIEEAREALEAQIDALTAEVRAKAGAIDEVDVRLEAADLAVDWTLVWVPETRPRNA
jgi:hypothetical protein